MLLKCLLRLRGSPWKRSLLLQLPRESSPCAAMLQILGNRVRQHMKTLECNLAKYELQEVKGPETEKAKSGLDISHDSVQSSGDAYDKPQEQHLGIRNREQAANAI